ncbi:MAG: hypothetical protein H8D23_30780 [Candidatus Brocadiales bacterium]|nr:hypothetical protein [Candidatus Brocadiales bacterium]
MSYKKIKSHKLTEEELRGIWKTTYCDEEKPIFTFDSIHVIFRESMFDHVFYESHDRKRRDKSIFSLNRCQKILWIKDTLEDSTAILKQGWDRDAKKYIKNRRVAFVKNNYIVIIQFISKKMARFISAYEMQGEENIAKILGSPDWEGFEE